MSNKIFVVFAILLLTTTSSGVELHAVNPFGTNMTNLVEFLTGLWGYFALVESSAYTCFNATTAGLYFDYHVADYYLVGALVAGNRTELAQLTQEFDILAAQLSTTLSCFASTNDYKNLIAAAGGNLSDPNYQLLLNLYSQAYEPNYFVAMNKTIDHIIKKRFLQAGVSFAVVLQTEFTNSTMDTIYFEAFKGFQNGIWFFMNLTAPYELANCYNESQGQSAIEFYYYWAQTVNQSTLENVANNTENYLNGAGQQYLDVVGVINQCLEQTNDQQRLTDALGWDVHSSSFDSFIETYFFNETLSYYENMNIMWNFFTQNDAFGAGELMGNFYYNVAVYANASSTASIVA